MGAGWFVACETRGRVDLPHGGRALLFAQYQLEEIARTLELPPLKEYFSGDPAALARYFAEQGLDPEQFDLPEESWHDPRDVLETVRPLLLALDDSIPGRLKVQADLEMIRDTLESAAATGDRVHIATAMPDLRDREPG